MLELATYVAFFALAVKVGSRVPLGRPVELRIAALSPLFGLVLVGVDYATWDSGLNGHGYATRAGTMFSMATVGAVASFGYLAGPAAEYLRLGPDRPPETNMFGTIVGPVCVILAATFIGATIACVTVEALAVAGVLVASVAAFFFERKQRASVYGAASRRFRLFRAANASVLAGLMVCWFVSVWYVYD